MDAIHTAEASEWQSMTVTARAPGPPGAGEFEIQRVLGHGPAATVYLARQIALNRHIALKVAPDDREESKTTANLEHDHIVRVFSEKVEPERGRRFICRQYIPGATLAHVIEKLKGKDRATLRGQDILAVIDGLTHGPNPFRAAYADERLRFAALPFEEAVACIGAKVAEALAHAHKRGALHLNIKPGNILVNPYGRPFLADFTLFRQRFGFTGAPPALDRVAIRYAGPEYLRARGRGEEKALLALDGRSDLYALALVLKELYGEAPEAEASPLAALPHVDLNRILDACLADDPAERLADAETLAAKLKGLLEFRRIREAMPEPGPLMRMSLRRPLLSLVLFRQLPHLAGTAVCVLYSGYRRGLALNPEQKGILMRLGRVYNAISYPFGIAVVILIAVALIAAFRRRGFPGAWNRMSAPELAYFRRRSLQMPLWLAGINTMTWLPSIPFFAFAAYNVTHRFNPSGFFHFASAVVLSWLIATSYSTLYALFFSVQVLYPRFLELGPDTRLIARDELGMSAQCLEHLPLVLAFIPLLAAVLLVQQDPGHLCLSKFQSFQLLLMGLIVLGAAGFLFSLGAIRRLNRVVRALTDTPVKTKSF